MRRVGSVIINTIIHITMKRTIKIEKEVDFKLLKCKIGARYWEDTEINGVEDENGDLIPCRKGDYWCPIIDIENGIIINWEEGKEANIHYKVCDDGNYTLIAEDDIKIHYEGYAPSILDVTEESFGDYIIMNVGKTGIIENWNKNPSIDEFLELD